MSPYETPEALRIAFEARIRSRVAPGDSTSSSRLRRAAVFESVARRLGHAEPGRWVVKGGMCLEWRYGNIARATLDLDLCVDASDLEPSAIRERIIHALGDDPASDRFVFEVGEAEALLADVFGRAGYRFAVIARMGARRFERVKLDVVPRLDEIVFREELKRPSAFAFAGVPPLRIEVAAPAQHFAEKLHALTRDHGDRPNSRVHDLVELVLLIERDSIDPGDVAVAVAHVYRIRATHEVPGAIPDPPVSWKDRYPIEARGCGVGARTVEEAMRVLRAYWSIVRSLERG